TDALILGCFAAAAALGFAFVRWERHTGHPMLNLAFFHNPRFSVASTGISLASFALFGSIFALTQYLQYAQGYSALEAGAGMVPVAFGLMAGAGSSVKLVPAGGPASVMTAGLVGLGTLLSLSLFWTADMPYWQIGLWTFGLAISMGWIIGPGTGSVMGSVPKAKSGVASAMNDVTRQVGGALGVAVMGPAVPSLLSSSDYDSSAAPPRGARGPAEDSVGGATAVAASLPRGQGEHLVHAAGTAYTNALGIGFTVAAAFALIAAVLVKLWLPSEGATQHAGDEESTPDAAAEAA